MNDGTEIDEGLNVDDELHVYIRQVGKRHITLIVGMDEEEMRSSISSMKKRFCCMGAVCDDPMVGIAVKFSGDQRDKVVEYFKDRKVKVHGY